MIKCDLYKYGDWKLAFPGMENRSKKYLSAFNSTGTQATIFGPLAKAVMAYASGGSFYDGVFAYDDEDIIIGCGKPCGDTDICIAEYRIDGVTTHIACFDGEKQEFLFAGITHDGGETYEKYVLSKEPDNTVLWLSILNYLYYKSSEIMGCMDSLASRDLVKEMKELAAGKSEFNRAIQRNLFILCDSVYHQLGDNIPINIPSSGIFPAVPDDKTLNNLYLPSKTTMVGNFTVKGLSKKKVAKAVKAVSGDELQCMYALNEHMTAEEKKLVPKMPDWYVVPKWVLKAAHNIQFHHKNGGLDSASKQNNIFLFGEPGTGKSEGAKAIASALGLPCTHISMSANSDEFVFTGQIIPEVEGVTGNRCDIKKEFGSINEMLEEISLDPETAYCKLTGSEKANATAEDCMTAYANTACVVNGNSGVRYKFVESDFCRAIENGWLVTIEEFTNVRDAGVGIILNQLMDGYQTITLPTGKVIHRHQNTVIVFASNVDEANCGEFETSTLSRLKPMYNISTPTKTELIKRVVKVTGYNGDMNVVSQMADVVIALRDYIKNHALVGTCGVREFSGWLLQFLANKDFDEESTLRGAAMETIVPSASPHEEDIEEIMRDIIDTML